MTSSIPSSSKAVLAPELLSILVCPITKGPLHYNQDAGELISPKAGVAYPIREGIPVMLIEEARDLSDDEKKHFS